MWGLSNSIIFGLVMSVKRQKVMTIIMIMFIVSMNTFNEQYAQILFFSYIIYVQIIFSGELMYLSICNFIPAEFNNKNLDLYLDIDFCFIFIVIHFCYVS